MMRDGIEYKHMPASVDLNQIRTVATPFRAGSSKLELARELIEQIHTEALAFDAGLVEMGELAFRTLDEADGLQAYTYVRYFRSQGEAA